MIWVDKVRAIEFLGSAYEFDRTKLELGIRWESVKFIYFDGNGVEIKSKSFYFTGTLHDIESLFVSYGPADFDSVFKKKEFSKFRVQVKRYLYEVED